jgi:hypothetical protein
MRADRGTMVRAKPFSEPCKLSAEITGLDDRLRDLREKATAGADILSASRSAAALHVDLIASGLALQNCVDAIAFQVLDEGCPIQEKTRRLTRVLRMADTVQRIIIRAIESYLSCFGGKESIAIQATAECIKRQVESAPPGAGRFTSEQFMEAVIKRSKKPASKT